jgi:hypothetical protein
MQHNIGRAEPEIPPVVDGVLHFHDETGTRGGYWAVQDKRFISPNTTRFVCRKCGVYWDKELQPQGPSDTSRMYTFPLPPKEPDACPPGQHDFELASKETWSYDGLHILADGDRLTIYDTSHPEMVIWSGTVRLRPYPRYTEKALGCWIHADQEGVQREVWARWFFDGNPAKLVSAPKRVEESGTS